MEIWVMPLWVAPFLSGENSRSPFLAHGQGACDDARLLLLSPSTPFPSQSCSNWDDEYYDCPIPKASSHTSCFTFLAKSLGCEDICTTGPVPSFQLWLQILMKGTLLPAPSCICSGQLFCKLEYISILTYN